MPALDFLQSFFVAHLAGLADFHCFITLVGGLFLLDLLAFLPVWREWFSLPLLPVWGLAILSLASNSSILRVCGTLVLWFIFRHYFISQRWSKVRRGGGAPGFMAHWTALHLCLLQLAAMLDASGALIQKAFWVARTDFAIIMLCAGVYKCCVGYLSRDGMEYGRVNPMWGYHWRFFSQKGPHGWYPQLMNKLACLVEVGGALLLLTPGREMIGAALISLSFLYVSFFIRLGRLAWLMAILPMLYHPDMEASLCAATDVAWKAPSVLILTCAMCASFYVALLPIVKLTQYVNLFLDQRWPKPLQEALDRYANAVPIIMWRVFTPDVTNFYVKIYDGAGLPLVDEKTYTIGHWSSLWLKLRMLHVCESIALTSVFTTLRYFPSQPKRFEERLIKYAGSLRSGPQLVFVLVAIHKARNNFEFIPVDRFHVNIDRNTVQREQLEPSYDFSKPSLYSPVREAQRPGSYVAAKS